MKTYEIIGAICIIILLILTIIALALTYNEEKKERQLKKEQLTAIQKDLKYLREKVQEFYQYEEKEDEI